MFIDFNKIQTLYWIESQTIIFIIHPMYHRLETEIPHNFNISHQFCHQTSIDFRKMHIKVSDKSHGMSFKKLIPSKNQTINKYGLEDNLTKYDNKQIQVKKKKLQRIVKNPLWIQLNKNSSFTAESTFSTFKKQQLKLNNQIPSFLRKKTNQISFSNRFFNNLQLKNKFRKIKKLGEGKYGQVYLVKEQTINLLLAMKIIQKKLIIQSNLIKQFIRQLKLQSYLKHPNIIQLYGFIHDHQHFYLLFEFGCHGQLYKIIQNTEFNQESGSIITRSILSAVLYMHFNKALHRDIKPQNIVVVHLTHIQFREWAVNTQKQELRQTHCGTPLCFAPELINRDKYDEKVDLWAIGVLCFEIIYKASPFKIEKKSHLNRIVTNQISYPSHKKPSNEFKTSIKTILQKNLKKRLSAELLLNFQYITKYKENDSCQELLHF